MIIEAGTWIQLTVPVMDRPKGTLIRIRKDCEGQVSVILNHEEVLLEDEWFIIRYDMELDENV